MIKFLLLEKNEEIMRNLWSMIIKVPLKRRKYQEGEGIHSVVVVIFHCGFQQCLNMNKHKDK
jgi:hypothetical protein